MGLTSFLLLLLFSILSISASNAASSMNEPVIDVDGKVVQAGVRYVILPAMKGTGGGIRMGSGRDNTSCYSGVIQDIDETNIGIPVVFFPINKTKGAVGVSTDMNIMFSVAYTLETRDCVNTFVWQLGAYDETKQYYVTTGGERGNPGPSTVRNWFKIEKKGSEYNLGFCPSVCIFCKIFCLDVGIYVDNGVRRLALSDTPWKVKFKKVGFAL